MPATCEDLKKNVHTRPQGYHFKYFTEDLNFRLDQNQFRKSENPTIKLL